MRFAAFAQQNSGEVQVGASCAREVSTYAQNTYIQGGFVMNLKKCFNAVFAKPKRPGRDLLCWTILFTFTFLHGCGYYNMLKRKLTTPAQFQSLDSRSPYLKAHTYKVFPQVWHLSLKRQMWMLCTMRDRLSVILKCR